MPWDPKPQPAAPPQQVQAQQQQQQPQNQPQPSAQPSAQPNGLPPPSSYPSNPYDNHHSQANGARIKTENGPEQQQFHGLPTNAQGGLARAQQLVQQQYGSAPLNAMQQRGNGLALPGQQQKPPQGIQLPPNNAATQQFQQKQQAAMQRQQQQLQQQQAQPRIKVENESPKVQQGGFNQQPNYGQTDGADEDDMAQWRAMLAERRALHAAQGQQADHVMRDQVERLSENLSNGLMVPLADHASTQSNKNKKRRTVDQSRSVASSSSTIATPSIPQLDGVEDEEKPDIKDEDDADAINSDLDDSDDGGANAMGDDDDDEGDNILCTYDKVQRVKNKWKCTLKDGVMMANGKEWVFHKGMGEFEW